MKLLLLIYSGPTPQRIAALLEAHEAPGYTQFENARGAGGTGRIEGTRAWPGTATVFMSVVPAERATELRDALQAYRSAGVEGEHLHVATIPMEDYF
ncbi:MAG: hypothetical protein IPF87_04240 [Gemmatimonadetes bacterium]|jgi:hypothetical protein|nr:hypothetical protein [Gemmatimonadota bacterium]HNV74966.1 hypothetical protein [Gemmatimonadaceae bacterium]MBK6841472.1 hypothetical protein [Gemmatimonadota bacterium]MBK7835153.1 hypothetical protein [Gemmatimonadota bacterium]MBK8061566.1 hypothetical protein [Gemmatimonadota bacterium]